MFCISKEMKSDELVNTLRDKWQLHDCGVDSRYGGVEYRNYSLKPRQHSAPQTFFFKQRNVIRDLF